MHPCFASFQPFSLFLHSWPAYLDNALQWSIYAKSFFSTDDASHGQDACSFFVLLPFSFKPWNKQLTSSDQEPNFDNEAQTVVAWPPRTRVQGQFIASLNSGELQLPFSIFFLGCVCLICLKSILHKNEHEKKINIIMGRFFLLLLLFFTKYL